jgi:predicted ester cyclase
MNNLDLNKALLERYFFEGWNQGRLDVFDDIIHPNYQNHNPFIPNLLPGAQGLKATVALLRVAFPDLKFVIEDQIISDLKVATRCTMYGTHKGALFDIAPTGKRVAVKQFQIDRFVDGRIIEHWRVSDALGMLRQLGQAA